MAKHTNDYTLPDCPKCGAEMVVQSRGIPPFDFQHPFGYGKEYWYKCPDCGKSTTPCESSGVALETALKECRKPRAKKTAEG